MCSNLPWQDKLDLLNSTEYFKIFIENLQKKCKQAIKLFKVENMLQTLDDGPDGVDDHNYGHNDGMITMMAGGEGEAVR